MGGIFESGSLISQGNTWMLWGILAVTVAVSVYLEQRYRWASRFSAPVIAIVIAFILANVHIIPTVSAVYDTAGTYCIPLATALMLYQANAKNILKNSGKMFICMNIGIVASLIGGLIGFLLLKDRLTEGTVFTASAIASYIGGTANFVAVGTSNGLSNTMITVGAFTENFIMTLCIIALLWIPTSKFFQAHYPHPYQKELEQMSTGGRGHREVRAALRSRTPFPARHCEVRGCGAGNRGHLYETQQMAWGIAGSRRE